MTVIRAFASMVALFGRLVKLHNEQRRRELFHLNSSRIYCINGRQQVLKLVYGRGNKIFLAHLSHP